MHGIATDIFCFRGVDLLTEMQTHSVETGASMSDSWQTTFEAQRSCDYFERHRPGMGVQRHIDIQERAREIRTTAFVALTSAVIGGLIAGAASVVTAVLTR